MLEEFVQELHQKSIILAFDVYYAQSSLCLRLAISFPSCKTCASSVNITFTPQTVLSEDINLFGDLGVGV